MKTVKTLIAVGGVVASCSLFAEPPKSQYDHYCDWKFETFRVATTNASDDVRLHFDLTQPLHGPWLTNPGVSSMTVSYQSRCNCGAAVEYREKGTEEWKRKWQLVYGLVDYAHDVHSIHLDGLKPGTTYEYRFVCASDRYQTAYADAVIGREIWEFKTLDAARRDFKVFVTTDVHGSTRYNLDYQYERSGAKDADFYIFLGDNVEDSMAQADFYVTSGWLDYAVALWGKYKPTVALRGNHDCWGFDAVNAWARWYQRPDYKSYYTVRQGNALFIVLDVPFPYHHTQANKEGPEQYLAEEYEWLKALKSTPEWKETKWRIALNHYGTRCASAFVDGWYTRDRFGAVLNGDDGSEPIDLLLCGDAHFYIRNLANSKEYVHNSKYDRPRRVKVKGKYQLVNEPWSFTPHKSADPEKVWRYAEVCNATSSAAILEIGEKTLKYVDHDYKQIGQPPLDQFTLTK